MKVIIMSFIVFILSLSLKAQQFYLGNYLAPISNEFELIGISSKTGVHSYKYKKVITEPFFNRKVGDIIVGIRDGIIVTTVYNLIPKNTDNGVPKDIIKILEENFPFPFKEVNGIYGLNIDNESISVSRVNNSLTFGKDRIMIMNSVKQSILERTKK